MGQVAINGNTLGNWLLSMLKGPYKLSFQLENGNGSGEEKT